MKVLKVIIAILLLVSLITGCGSSDMIIEREEAEEVEEKVPEGMELYSSPHGYSVMYPKMWQTVTGIGKVSEKNSDMDFFTQDEKSGSNISIDTVELSQSFYEITSESFEKGMTDSGVKVEMIEFFRGIKNGMVTLEMKYTALGNTITQIYFVNDDLCHSVAYTEKTGTDKSVSDMMNAVISSFKISK